MFRWYELFICHGNIIGSTFLNIKCNKKPHFMPIKLKFYKQSSAHSSLEHWHFNKWLFFFHYRGIYLIKSDLENVKKSRKAEIIHNLTTQTLARWVNFLSYIWVFLFMGFIYHTTHMISYPALTLSKNFYMAFKYRQCQNQCSTVVPNHFDTRDRFHGRQFFHRLGLENGLGLIQAHHIYCALYFYQYYISSMSDLQALDPRG